MLKVVLADDEPSVLEGLRIFVNWDKLGFKIVGEASDGAASFSVIDETRPELVICDIRMPGLNGLELIEKVNNEISTPPKFILLSGYNDFIYAQKALQLGALGYLTKPLGSEELENELCRAAGIIENEKYARQENLELIRYTANQLFNDIMDGKRSEKLGRKARNIFDIPESAKIRIVQFIADSNENIINNPESIIYDLLIRLTGIQNESCLFYNGNGSYIIIMNDSMQIFSDGARSAEKLAAQLRDADLKSYGIGSFWLLISGINDSGVIDSIYKCGRQLEQLQTYCMLHPENSVVNYEELEVKTVTQSQFKPGRTSIFPNLPFDKVVNSLKGNDVNQVISAVDEFFLKLKHTAVSRRLYSICLYRLADVVMKMSYADGIEANRVILNFTASVGNLNPNCKKLALEMCKFIFQKQNIHNDKPLFLLENEIIDYIKGNYTKALSLQSIAEKFSLSAIIISKIIKKKTGQKFNDYFNYLRIEHAKMLIASANMKITAVCEESGYSDYRYFTEKFKEFTGISPSEYKKKYS